MAEQTIIHRIPPCSNCDIEALGSWLTDMAREGWYLAQEGVGKYRWTFYKDQPREVPYRLIPGRKAPTVGTWLGKYSARLPDDPGQADLEKYTAQGWEYVDRQGHFYIYRGSRDFDGSLRVEPRFWPEDIAQAAKHERAQVPFVIFLLFVVLPGSMYLFFWRGQPFRFLDAYLPALILTLIIGAVFLLHYGMHLMFLRRIRRKLEEGSRLDHKKDWKRASLRNRVGKVIFSAFLILWSVAFSFMTDTDSDVQLLEGYPGHPPFVTLEELLPDLKNRDGMYGEESSLLIPVQLDWWEHGEVEHIRGAFYQVYYYETRTPAMARQLAEELWHEDENKRLYRGEELPDLDVDYALVYNEGKTVLIQEGNRVVRATLNQDGEPWLATEDWTAQLAEALERDLS